MHPSETVFSNAHLQNQYFLIFLIFELLIVNQRAFLFNLALGYIDCLTLFSSHDILLLIRIVEDDSH